MIKIMVLTAILNFFFQNEGLQISDLKIFSREDLEGKIHFGHFPSLSFGPSQCHNSVNIGSNSTSRDSFVICRSRVLIWHQDWWYFLMNCWRNQLLKFWPRLYLTYCISDLGHGREAHSDYYCPCFLCYSGLERIEAECEVNEVHNILP